MAVSAEMLQKALTGNAAGWSLAFHREVLGGLVDPPDLLIGSDDYYADISASLPANLEGGSYHFVIEGMTDDHYATIARAGGFGPTVVRLYLYWRDTNSSVGGYLANLAGLTDLAGTLTGEWLVAELAITNVSRRSGERRYETVVSARERIYHNLRARSLAWFVPALDPLEAIGLIVTTANLPWSPTPTDGRLPEAQTTGSAGDELGLELGRSLLDHVKQLGERVTWATGKFGRGVFLIRDGMLHVGQRPIPLEGESKDIHIGNGLIEVEALGTSPSDPSFQIAEDADPSTPAPGRKQYKLTLKGRPDLKPGDVVRFDPPELEIGKTLPSWTGVIGELLSGPLIVGGGVSESAISLYVAKVDHRLGRRSGFVTTLTGVEILTGEDGWDTWTPSHLTPPDSTSGETSAEGRAALAITDWMSATQASRRLAEVGEIRSVTTSASSDVPAQTVRVWRGLAPPDGLGNGARRLAIQRPSPMPAGTVAYLTPFAWGKCGLILPRYPGTRVLVVHRNGERDDPLDAGALWESGHGPDSEPGDWWLTLPVGVPESARSSLEDTDTPTEHTGPVTNDLIDADGNRVIEVGELTVRIGQAALQSAGQRPSRGSDEHAVTIEHADGESSIVMKADGTVTIVAKQIEFDAGSGDITLKAANVKVQVSGSMDVS